MFITSWTYVLATIIGAFAIYFLQILKRHKYFENHGIPYKSPVPIFGNMLPIIFRQKNMGTVIRELYNKYPNKKYFGFYDFMNPVIVLRDMELIKSVAVKNFDSFPDHRTFVKETWDPLFGRNLFSLKGEKWHDVRSLLSPAFTSSKMKIMFKLISQCASDFTEILANDIEGNKMREMKEAFTRYTNDVIATCAFGISVNTMKDPNNDFYVLGKEATNLEKLTIKFFFMREFPYIMRLLNIKLVAPRIEKFFTNIIKSTINIRDTKGITRPDMLQLMMDARGKGNKVDLTAEEMTAQAFIFFFGGFDSTSTNMSFAAHEIAINSDVQKKLQNEIDCVLRDTNGDPTYDAINGMEYLDAVVNETLRKYPLVPSLDRVCSRKFELPPNEIGGKPFIIEPGMTVWIPAVAYHYDSQYYEEPEKFNPNRFLGNDAAASIKSTTFLSFGLGPRQCIGNRFALLETKTMLFHLLARCNLKICPKTNVPMKLSKKTFGFSADGGYWMQLEKRDNKFLSNGIGKN
ncbi:cytochrome P450 9e2-like [Leptopilina boulardi]|uniref:cytochrome P450 9e2-like n=1 Tax=Leptopilina boulardi TaxID=63433 RepID=UPI0021F586B4|nr:cytochrome P450 9e2-like [Leptopilina boulardi]